MYLELIKDAFIQIAEKSIPELNNEEFISRILQAVEKNKYDVQDQTFIETSLKDDKESFIESFIELFEKNISKIEDHHDYLNSEEGQSEVISLFSKSVDYTVDFCYNAIISKQFSQT